VQGGEDGRPAHLMNEFEDCVLSNGDGTRLSSMVLSLTKEGGISK
jgi:hypothetical protein